MVLWDTGEPEDFNHHRMLYLRLVKSATASIISVLTGFSCLQLLIFAYQVLVFCVHVRKNV